MSKLLVVDDEQSICWGLSRLGDQLGHQVTTASSAEQALALPTSEQPELIFLDVRLPGMSGLDALKHFRQRWPDVPIVLMTAYGDLDTAVGAVRQGAFEYIVKPFGIDEIKTTLTHALSTQIVAVAPQARPHENVVGGLVGKSPVMQEVFKQIAFSAGSEANVLITGESGTGKELVARAIHQFSCRAAGPFVAVNVAALSPSLAESELFGHSRGAFTGAENDRPGLLKQADGGTLFLDEVAEIPLSIQVKLLRAIEHGEVTPVGSETPVRAEFRIVSASHQALADQIQDGRFRHDLYYRLCAFQIELPPLRQRAGDVPELARFFVDQLTHGRQHVPDLSERFLASLSVRHWPGNVRELRNSIEHALIMGRQGPLLPEHLPQEAETVAPLTEATSIDGEADISDWVRRWSVARLRTTDSEGTLLDDLAAVVEPPLFREAIRDSFGQAAAAARKLGIHRTTMKKKLDQYGIE